MREDMARAKDWKEVKALIDGMDEDDLRLTIGVMAHILGLDETSRAIDLMSESRDGVGADRLRAPSPEEMHERVKYILMNASGNAAEICDVDFDDFDPDDYDFHGSENMLMREMIEEEYGDFCLEISEFGDPEEIGKIVRGVAEALRDSDIPWTHTPEDLMDYRRKYADAIEKRLEDGDIGKLFSDFERCVRIVRSGTYF